MLYLDAPSSQLLSPLFTTRAESARINLVSRQDRSRLAARTRAATPETIGVDALVPLKPVQNRLRCRVLVIPQCSGPLSVGAHTHRFGPGLECM